MDKVKTKILMLVEGEKMDVKLMTHLLEVYGLNDGYEIVSYNTNIYTLYNQMFADHDPAAYDLVQVLKARETNANKKAVFDQAFSDILLVFDLDAHAPDFSPEKIREMVDYFQESSDMGKLYLNYPMAESFYHMQSIPDPDYSSYTASITEGRKYKERVTCITGDQRKFARTKEECNIVICQNIEKSNQITAAEENSVLPANQIEILDVQLDSLLSTQNVFVLSTCPFYIVDYNPNLLK